MSVKVMTMIWDRYPEGGGDMLLALALADHSHDDGTHIYPSVDSLAKKTRQSVRTVQYQLGRMKQSGWLIATNAGDGGRGRHTEYRISPDWINGANFAFDGKKGASDDAKGCNPQHERVQSDARKGATAIAPANNQEESSLEPSRNRSASRSRAARSLSSVGEWLEACKANGELAIPEDDTIFDYARKQGLPEDFIRYAWLEFKRKYAESGKKQKDWRATFRNAVRENWYGLWFLADDGNWLLTTRGKQVQREHSEGA